jgi:transcriptional regulator with XRE-family HTH domain
MTTARTADQIVGGNMRALRLAAGLTQGELGAAMVDLGFPWRSRQTVAEIEAGRRAVTLEELVAIAAYFDMPVNTMLTGAGTAIPHSDREVWVGNRTVKADAWTLITTPRTDQEPPNEIIGPAIDDLVGDLDRPWSRRWRELGGHPAAAFADAWKERSARRMRQPGPIYVIADGVEGPVSFSTVVGPWSQTIPITLTPGVPYAARDESEAEALADRERQGFVKRLSRQQAYRLRQKGDRHGMDS